MNPSTATTELHVHAIAASRLDAVRHAGTDGYGNDLATFRRVRRG